MAALCRAQSSSEASASPEEIAIVVLPLSQFPPTSEDHSGVCGEVSSRRRFEACDGVFLL